MKNILVWAALIAAVLGNGLVLVMGGWHLYRYEIAPRYGLLDDVHIWEENMAIATSAFYKPEEKIVALDRLLHLESYATSLTETERQALAAQMRNLTMIEFYSLDLKYKAARVGAMLIGEQTNRDEITIPKPAASENWRLILPDVAATLTATTEGLRRSSPERTKFFVEWFRAEPCAPELVQLMHKFLAREDLPSVERSFLFGIQVEVQAKCS